MKQFAGSTAQARYSLLQHLHKEARTLRFTRTYVPELKRTAPYFLQTPNRPATLLLSLFSDIASRCLHERQILSPRIDEGLAICSIQHGGWAFGSALAQHLKRNCDIGIQTASVDPRTGTVEIRSNLATSHLVLVDNSINTGETLKKSCRILAEHGIRPTVVIRLFDHMTCDAAGRECSVEYEAIAGCAVIGAVSVVDLIEFAPEPTKGNILAYLHRFGDRTSRRAAAELHEAIGRYGLTPSQQSSMARAAT